MSLDVLFHKLKVKIGKAQSSEIPAEYKLMRENLAKFETAHPKIAKSLTKFCQKYEKASKAQMALGECLSALALEEQDTDIGELMLKTGEGIKTLASIQHAMLVNHIDKVVKPLQKLEQKFKAANNLDSCFCSKHAEYDSLTNKIANMPEGDPKKSGEVERHSGLKSLMDESYQSSLEATKDLVQEKGTTYCVTVCQILLNFHHNFSEAVNVTTEMRPTFEEAQKKRRRVEEKKEVKKEEKKVEPKKEDVKTVQKTPELKIPENKVEPGNTSSSKPPPPKHSPRGAEQLCIALYNYDKQSNDELSLKINDIIKVTKKDPDGWWHGELGGKGGIFPENYVKSIAKVITTKALYDYKALENGEISFKAGQSIIIYVKNEDGWYFGEISGKRGLFPGNYTEEGK